MSNWTEDDHMSPEQEVAQWEEEEAVRLGVSAEPHRPLSERMKPLLLRSLLRFWSDIDEVRKRAGINVGASMHAKRGLDDLVTDGLAECLVSNEQYRLSEKGRAAALIADFDLLVATGRLPDLPNHNTIPSQEPK